MPALTNASVFCHGPRTSDSLGDTMPACVLPLLPAIELATSNA
jgi:hypothetical protein